MSNIQNQLEALDGMTMKELQAEFERVTGTATRVPNMKWLKKKIIEGLQAKAAHEGDDAEAEPDESIGGEVEGVTDAQPATADRQEESAAEVDAKEGDADTAEKEAEVDDTEEAATDEADTAADADTESEATAQPAVQPTRDPRLPIPGTVIVKRDRAGNERCRCTVMEGNGVEYNGKLYSSISASAAAAAADLGLKGAVNGFLFWLGSAGKLDERKPRSPKVKASALQKAWDRYQTAAREALDSATDETRPGVQAEIEAHAKALDAVHKPAP